MVARKTIAKVDPGNTDTRYVSGANRRYEKEVHKVDSLLPLRVTFKVRAEASVHQRDYFIGSVQCAYVRRYKDGFHLIISTARPETSLQGKVFPTEKELHEFLKEQLMAVER